MIKGNQVEERKTSSHEVPRDGENSSDNDKATENMLLIPAVEKML